jgi:hypothetical protein
MGRSGELSASVRAEPESFLSARIYHLQNDRTPPTDADNNSHEYGFRVLLIVVSKHAKRGYIFHVPHDFGSILKFIEELYGLPSLGYADSRADDLSDCFNFESSLHNSRQNLQNHQWERLDFPHHCSPA